MADEGSIPDLIRQVRAGDQKAAEALVQRFGPELRRVVRVQLRDPRLRRVLDSVDICQSVMADFFKPGALDRYQLDTPEQLFRLLATMARNALINQVHKHHADCRDQRLVEAGDVAERQVAGQDPTPSQNVAAQELLQEVGRRLTPEEQQIWELKREGHSWGEIAQKLGGNPESLRKKLERALDQVKPLFGLDEAGGR